MTLNGYGTGALGLDSNGAFQTLSVDTDGKLNVDLTNGYNLTNDTLKVETAGQQYYDLLCNPVTVAANTTSAIGAGSNYTLSATGGWITHPLFKRARAFQIWGNFAYATEVKPYCSPVDAPDQNTTEYQYKSVTEQSWAFVQKDGTSVTAATPACGRIMPCSMNALKVYFKNNDVTNAETVTFIIRLFF